MAIKLEFHDEIADAKREILDKKMRDILVLDNRIALCPLAGSGFDLVFSTPACKYFNISLKFWSKCYIFDMSRKTLFLTS